MRLISQPNAGELLTTITGGDLDDYIGNYNLRITSASDASQVANVPFQAAMRIECVPYLGNTSCIQKAYNTTYGEYIRYYTSAGWTTWKKYSTT